MATASEVAAWMVERLDHGRGVLYQSEAADGIRRRFGASFVVESDEGYVSIEKGVLAEFRKLTMGAVVWERGEKYWRRKARTDGPGRTAS